MVSKTVTIQVYHTQNGTVSITLYLSRSTEEKQFMES